MAINAKFQADGVYEGRVPLLELQQDLTAIDRSAEAATASRRKLRWVAAGIFVVGIAVGIAAVPVLIFLSILAAVGVFIFSFFYRRSLQGNKTRVQFLRDLMATLQQDTEAKAPFTVLLALKDRQKLLKEEPWTERKKGKQQSLEDEWFSLGGQLLDGTEFSETVVDLIRKRTYTNPRGKSKTKLRRRFLLTLQLTYPRGVYGDARPIHAGLKDAIRVPSSTTVKDVDVSEKAITIKAVVDSETDLKQSNIMLFLGAYRILNLARQSAVQGGTQ